MINISNLLVLYVSPIHNIPLLSSYRIVTLDSGYTPGVTWSVLLSTPDPLQTSVLVTPDFAPLHSAASLIISDDLTT
jgi:hypothetical protein